VTGVTLREPSDPMAGTVRGERYPGVDYIGPVRHVRRDGKRQGSIPEELLPMRRLQGHGRRPHAGQLRVVCLVRANRSRRL